MQVGLLHYTAPPIIGGVESTVRHQAVFLAEAGHAVTVIAGEGQTFDSRIALARVDRVNSRHPDILDVKAQLDGGVCPPAFGSLTASLQAELAGVLAPLDAVIIHNALSLHKNLPLTAALWELASGPGTRRWIAWHHDLAWDRPDYADELYDGEPWDRLRRPLPGARHVAVSNALRNRVVKVFGLAAEAVSVIPPGVDEPSFGGWGEGARRIAKLLRLQEADLILLLPSRLTRRKNIGFALRVIAEIRRRHPGDARLLITGPPGPHNPANRAYLAELQAQARELHLDDAAHFLYLLDPDAPSAPDDETLRDLFRVADALLFPSLDEGFGIPVLEAGLARLPVFCSDIPPFRESGSDWTTRFALDASADSVAQLILDGMEADRGYQLRRRVRREFTWDALLTRRLLPLLEGIDDG